MEPYAAALAHVGHQETAIGGEVETVGNPILAVYLGGIADRRLVSVRRQMRHTGATLDEPMVANLVNTNVELMDRYLPALSLVFQGTPVNKALSLVETVPA